MFLTGLANVHMDTDSSFPSQLFTDPPDFYFWAWMSNPVPFHRFKFWKPFQGLYLCTFQIIWTAYLSTWMTLWRTRFSMRTFHAITHLNEPWLPWCSHSCLTGTFVLWVSPFLCQTVHLPHAWRDRLRSHLTKEKPELLLASFWQSFDCSTVLRENWELQCRVWQWRQLPFTNVEYNIFHSTSFNFLILNQMLTGWCQSAPANWMFNTSFKKGNTNVDTVLSILLFFRFRWGFFCCFVFFTFFRDLCMCSLQWLHLAETSP